MLSLCLKGDFSNSKRGRAGAAGVAMLFNVGILHAQELPLDDLLAGNPLVDTVDAPVEEEVEDTRFTLPDEAEPESAQRFLFDLREELRYSDNPDLDLNEDAESVLIARTTALLGYARRTSVDAFDLQLGADLDLRTDGDSGIERPTFDLNWIRDVGNTNFGLSFGYSEVDLGSDTGTFFNEDTGSIDFGTIDSGTRQTTDYAVNGGFGLERPFGGNYLLSHRQIKYSDTEDPSLLDADRFIADGDIFFVITPRITLGLEGEHSDFDEDGEGSIDTTSNYFGTFADSQINSRLTGRFNLGWQRVEDTGAVNRTEDGVVFGAELDQETSRGSNFLNIGSIITSAGRENELRLGQSIEQLTRRFEYSVGLVDAEDSDIEPLFGLNWTEELPRGAFNVSLEQTPFTDRDTGTQINTLFTFRYDQDLNTRSGFSIELRYLDVNELNSEEADTQRLDLDLTYRYAVTEDWDITSGISFVRAKEDGAGDRDSDTIFVGLERRFVWN